MMQELQLAQVVRQISKLPDGEQPNALRWLVEPRRRRSGSQTFAQRNPKFGVTKEEKVLMKRYHDHGVSFRALEEIFHLTSNSGLAAQRCVRAVSK